jgi:single-strand DNA-binding protein
MKSLNRMQLIGNLGKNPEVKYTPAGHAVANFTIATNERRKTKEGNWEEYTEWHNIVLWQRLAEVAGEFLKKGDKCYIEGRNQTRSWEKDGVKHYTTEIIGSDLILLGGKPSSSGQTPLSQEEADQLVPF